MKVLQIGVGLIGQERISALLQITKDYSMNIDIIAVDKDQELLAKAKDNFNIDVYDDLSDVLKEGFDWVFISTPHATAAELAIEVFKYEPCNVLIEKPLGRNLKECDEIIQSKPKNVNLHVGLNYRFYQGINMLLNHSRRKFLLMFIKNGFWCSLYCGHRIFYIPYQKNTVIFGHRIFYIPYHSNIYIWSQDFSYSLP